MTLRWSRVAFVLLAVGAVATVAALLLRPSPAPEFVVDATPPPATPPKPRELLRPDFDMTNRGGTYAGRVVDEQDRPVARADVLLVAADLDAKASVEALEGEGTGTVLDIPVFGNYRTQARGQTDAEGRFSLPAGDAVVVALVAWAKEFAPGLLATTAQARLRPGPDHVVRVTRAGWLRGTVVDAVTKDPVPNADVAIFFQAIANQGRPGPEAFTPTNSFARFQSYVAKELGPLVWGIEGRAEDGSFRIATDRSGRFEFGPIMKEVQVWVVVTHPDYMWTESDPEVAFPEDNVRRPQGQPPLTRRQRLVVPAGETVERTYALVRGQEVKGTVLDAEGKPIEGVDVALEHVSEYAQHPWYRTHPRQGRTDANGRFRIAGLSYEPYNLRMSHPSFETEYFHGVKAGSDVEYRIAGSGGWIDLDVDGGPADKDWSARAIIEPAEGRGARREERIVVRQGHATLERVRPGSYDLTVVSGERVSQATRVVVAPTGGTGARVRMVDGGGVRLSVADSAGKPVDPVTVELDSVAGDRILRRAGLLVSRQGVAEGTGLLPGRYRARVRSMEYGSATTEPFDVAEGRVTTLAPVTLRRQGYLRVTGVVDADGRAVAGSVRLSIGAGGEPPQAVKLAAGVQAVTPGPVTVVAEAGDGRRFERTIQVGEGETVPVEIRFDR